MSKLNVWPGCMAYPVHEPGLFVEVIRPERQEEVFVALDGYKTVCEPSALPSWVVKSRDPIPWKTEDGRTHLFMECPYWDSSLRPITPPPGDVTDEEVRELFAPKQPETV